MIHLPVVPDSDNTINSFDSENILVIMCDQARSIGVGIERLASATISKLVWHNKPISIRLKVEREFIPIKR